MNQISRPMQIALGAVLVFAVLWFVALKPGDEEPVVDPAPVATTPAPVEAGGEQAQTGMGQAIESANEAADAAEQANAQREGATGEEDPSATTPGEASGTVGSGGGDDAATQGGGSDEGRGSGKQARADAQIRAIERHLEAGRAVVFLIWQRSGTEDKVVNRRVTREIDRRGGRVRVYRADVADVGLYDGLIGDLPVAQTPSTIVIAPNRQAKVLGGLVSTVRIDRLTSSALVSSERE